jgi:PPOX class probable FMN-dependent enzyme
MDETSSKNIIGSTDELRSIVGDCSGLAAKKSLPRLDQHCRQFIALTPFICVGTCSADGKADVSPRGDAPGFVRVIDDRTLLIPDRPGNNRVDTMSNIVENPSVGLIFMVPGFEDTLRINGRGSITRDPVLLASSEVNGKVPKLGILIQVEEAFLHCAKAFKRSELWDPASQTHRNLMPSLGRIILEQTAEAERPPAEAVVRETDERIEESYRTELY